MNFWRVTVVVFLFIFSVGCGQSGEETSSESGNTSARGTSASALSVDKVDNASKGSNQPFDLEAQKQAFQLTQFTVLDISESEYDKTPALAISFSVPIDASLNFDQFLSVTDKKDAPIAGGWILNQSRTRLYFKHVNPSTTYKVEVSSDISAITNKRLTKDFRKTIKTAALENSVRFLNKGNVLPADFTNGLAVESVNIKEVDVNFHRVEPDKVMNVVGEQLSGYYYQLEQLAEYSTLIYSARYSLDSSPNKRVTTNLPVHKIKALQQPGLYVATLKGAGTYPYEHEVTSFYISDMGLHIRSFDKAIEVHALNLSDGTPQQGVSLEVLSDKGKILQRGLTDAKGNHQLIKNDNASVVMARKGNSYSVIALNSPALDLSEQLSINRAQQPQTLFLYGPRDLYRPGEMIDVNGLLRDDDGQMVASVPLEVTILRPDNRVARQFSWHPTLDGFYQQSFEVAKNEPTGSWTFKVKHPGGEEFKYVFSIEDFLPETMKLTLDAEIKKTKNKKASKLNSSIKVVGQGDYLYGAPAAGNRISAKLKVTPSHYALENLKDYYFGQHLKQNEKLEVELADKKLDESGAVNWNLPNIWKDIKFPGLLTFEANLYESGGRPVTRRLKQLIWPAERFIGLRRMIKADYVAPFGTADFELINADSKGELHALGQLEVSLIRQDSRYYWRANEEGWDYSTNEKEKQVYTRVINADGNRANLNIPVEYGTYRLEIKDASGQLKNSYQFFAGWSWDESGEASVAGARPDKVRISFDKEAYKAGDIAKVTLISPHLGKVIVRIESDRLLWESQLELKALETVVEVPVSADWSRHDLYLSALVVSPPEEIEQLIRLPERALGIAPFRLDRSDRQLALSIDSPETIEPSQTVSIKLGVKGHANQDVYVTLAAVDTGALSVANFKTPAPHQWFYGQRAYSGNMRDSFTQLIKNHQAKSGVFRFGGDAELARGGEQPDTDVQIVSLFSDVVKFDQNGEAQVPLDLPEFNGELRLMALAFSGDKFGHLDKTMKVRAPVVAEISKPRFLAVKDKSLFALDVQNFKGQEMTFKVELKVAGSLKPMTHPLTLKLKDGERFTELFDITAEKVGQGHINLSLRDDKNNLLLEKSWMIAIRSAYPAMFKRQRKSIADGGSFTLSPDWIGQLDADSLQAKIAFSSVPPLNAEVHLQNLFQYPYGCLEQTSSRAWPLLGYNPATSQLKLDKSSLKVIAEKNKQIDAAILRINGMQRSDGSFGLWSNQSNENHWLTVYALEFLFEAKASGFAVPASVLESGTERLKYYVKSTGTTYSERAHYSNDRAHYAIAFRAYAAYLLSRSNQVTLSQLRVLNKKMAKKAKSGLPLAHLAAAFEKLGDTRAATSLWRKAIKFKSYSLSYSGDYGSEVRDIAWIMKLAAESKIDLDYQDLIFVINDKLASKYWYSTQGRFALYQLANSFSNQKQKDWQVKVVDKIARINSQLSPATQKAQRLSARDFKNKQSFQVKGSRLFMDLQVVGFPKSTPKPVSEGVSVKKSYYDINGNSMSMGKVKAGDYVLVKLDVIASQRMPDALVVDMLPAGFEIENPGLQYSYDFSEVMIKGSPVYRWLDNADIAHQEYRDDRFVAAVNLQRRQWASLFYLMRAVTSGEYQVPPTQVEDMYRPHLRAVGQSPGRVKVKPR